MQQNVKAVSEIDICAVVIQIGIVHPDSIYLLE